MVVNGLRGLSLIVKTRTPSQPVGFASKRSPAAFVAQFGGLHKFLMHKWYFDELYAAIFVRPAVALGRFFWKRGDEQTIDRFGPHGAAFAVGVGNRLTARLQSGFVYSYALVMLVGLIAAASWVLWWVS